MSNYWNMKRFLCILQWKTMIFFPGNHKIKLASSLIRIWVTNQTCRSIFFYFFYFNSVIEIEIENNNCVNMINVQGIEKKKSQEKIFDSFPFEYFENLSLFSSSTHDNLAHSYQDFLIIFHSLEILFYLL